MRATAVSRAGLSRGALAAVVLVTVAGVLTRLPALRSLPIFGDEAIFLRLARIVREAPTEQLWAGLRAPAAVAHVWLLALALSLSEDPVRAGRLLSVLLGVLTVLILAGAVHRIGNVCAGNAPDLAIASLAASALAAVSPFIVFSDRLARVESLFVLETVAAAWLSVEIVARTRPIAAAVAFGILMGLTMLTRQAVSYPLWLLPPLAALCAGRSLRRLAVPLLLALGIGIGLWAPILLAPGWPDLPARIFHAAASRPVLPLVERAALFGRNLSTSAAACWTYLTPPVLLAGVAGYALLAVRRRRLLAFLAGWEALLLVPPALFAGTFFPRYALPAAVPLIVAAGFAIGFAWTRTKPLARTALIAGILAWPVIDVGRGLANWHAWRLLPVDRRQFVSGWSAGAASESAAAFFEKEARDRPIVVIVPQVSGNPSDGLWLLLAKNPRIQIFYAEDFLRLPADRVKGDVWIAAPAATLPTDRPVFFVSQDPVFLGAAGWAPAEGVVSRLNPDARGVGRFANPPDEHGRVESAVALYLLR